MTIVNAYIDESLSSAAATACKLKHVRIVLLCVYVDNRVDNILFGFQRTKQAKWYDILFKIKSR